MVLYSTTSNSPSVRLEPFLEFGYIQKRSTVYLANSMSFLIQQHEHNYGNAIYIHTVRLDLVDVL